MTNLWKMASGGLQIIGRCLMYREAFQRYIPPADNAPTSIRCLVTLDTMISCTKHLYQNVLTGCTPHSRIRDFSSPISETFGEMIPRRREVGCMLALKIWVFPDATTFLTNGPIIMTLSTLLFNQIFTKLVKYPGWILFWVILKYAKQVQCLRSGWSNGSDLSLVLSSITTF